jgi:thiol-disulfide isomerase/thioredoxin
MAHSSPLPWTPRFKTPSIVFVKADWCGHCQRAKPEIDKLASLVGSVLPVYVADSEKHQAQIRKWGIQGFPTIFYADGQHMVPYEGERSAQRIADWACITSGLCAAGRRWKG